MGFLTGALGSIVGGIFGGAGQHSANQTNMEIAQAQMDFQREMSSTAHQRAQADLEKAGLNPILAANSAASSPGGAAIPVENVMAAGANTAKDLTNAVLNEQQKDVAIAQVEQIMADIELKSAQELLADADRYLKNNTRDVQEFQMEELYYKIVSAKKNAQIDTMKFETMIQGLRVIAEEENLDLSIFEIPPYHQTR